MMSNDAVDYFFKSLKQFLADERKLLEEAREEGAPRPINPRQTAAMLKVMLELYKVQETFKVGDLIQWKPGLQNRRFPTKGNPAIVVEVLPQVVMNPMNDAGSPYFQEVLDLRVGTVNQDGTLGTYLVSSTRFTFFRDDDEL